MNPKNKPNDEQIAAILQSMKVQNSPCPKYDELKTYIDTLYTADYFENRKQTLRKAGTQSATKNV